MARIWVFARHRCRLTSGPQFTTAISHAQALADAFNPEQVHERLRRYANWLCPAAGVFAQNDWHWSIRQAEYSTDLGFVNK